MNFIRMSLTHSRIRDNSFLSCAQNRVFETFQTNVNPRIDIRHIDVNGESQVIRPSFFFLEKDVGFSTNSVGIKFLLFVSIWNMKSRVEKRFVIR